MVGVFRTLVVALGLIACAGENASRTPDAGKREADRDPLSVRTPLERFKLANGLTVVLNEDHRVPLVAVRVVYRVGSSADPPERSGLAHLTEHLLFHGSRHVENGMHFQLLLEAGVADMNGSTALERTDYYQVVPTSELPLALWLESDRMHFGLENLSEASVEAELRILERERAERVDGVPMGRLWELTAPELYPPGHPLRAPIATSPELAQAKLIDVQAFFRAHYATGNAVLILAGDFEPASAAKLVRHYFGPIPARDVGKKPPFPAPTQKAAAIEVEARVDQAGVVLRWPTAPLFERGDTELDVLASYLNHVALKPLVSERKLFSSVFAEQSSDVRASTFRIGADLRSGVTHETALAALDAVLDGLRQRDLAPEEVTRHSRTWLHDIYADMDDLSKRSWFLAQAELTSGNADFMALAMKRYGSVTSASIRETVTRYLASDRRVVAFVKANPDAPLAGRIVGKP